jgi:hypothetical protein
MERQGVPWGWSLRSTVRPRLALHLQVSGDGEVLGFYTDMAGGSVSFLTHVEEHEGYLWLASLKANHVARIPLSALQ